MTRQFLAVAAAGGILLAGCAADPTDALGGNPAAIAVSASVLNVTVGDSILVTATTLDGQTVPLPTLPTATSESAGIGVVSANQPPLSVARFYVKGIAVDTGIVRVTAGSVSDSIVVYVN